MDLKSQVLKFTISILIIYILFGLLLFFMQKSILYYPNNQNFEKCIGFKDYEKKDLNSTRFYYKKNSQNNVIVYYHGNAGSACDRSLVKSNFEKENTSLIFVEYTGYSNSSKKPSQKVILQDVKNIHQFLKEENYSNIIIYGQSIGSGAASYHTSLGNVNSLILVNPFSSLTDVAKSKYPIYPISILLTENYNNEKWLENYKGNLLIIHGNKDNIIPHKFSKKLYENITNKNKEYILIENSGHNDIWFSKEFTDLIDNYLEKVLEEK